MSGSRGGGEPWALAGGLVLVLIGGAFLLGNLGLVRLDWDLVWPLILVVLGVAIVVGALVGTSGRGRRGWTGSPPPGEAWTSPAAGSGGGSWGDGDAQVMVPAEGAGRLELALRVGAGRYRLRGGAASLLEASASEPTIHHAVERAGDLCRVRLSTSRNPLAWGWRNGMDWRIGVAAGVPTMLEVQAGAGSFELDLSEVTIVSASMAIGAAEVRVVLPRPRGEVPIRVEGGAATFRFEVPAGVEARVAATGLVTTRGPSETPGYVAATDRVSVALTGGAASVEVVAAG